jgi:hypothetical protein
MTRRNPTDSPKSHPITRHGRPAARWPRRLAVVAFALALATIGFAATVASLASLVVPSPATPTVTTTVVSVPGPPGPPATSSPGGGR